MTTGRINQVAFKAFISAELVRDFPTHGEDPLLYTVRTIFRHALSCGSAPTTYRTPPPPEDGRRGRRVTRHPRAICPSQGSERRVCKTRRTGFFDSARCGGGPHRVEAAPGRRRSGEGVGAFTVAQEQQARTLPEGGLEILHGRARFSVTLSPANVAPLPASKIELDVVFSLAKMIETIRIVLISV